MHILLTSRTLGGRLIKHFLVSFTVLIVVTPFLDRHVFNKVTKTHSFTPSTYIGTLKAILFNSIFYSYKMREYQGGNTNALRQDLLLGGELSDDGWLKLSRRIGWVSWEDLAEVIFRYEGQVDNIPFDELRQFYQERNIFPKN